jgi:hypothetical protein
LFIHLPYQRTSAQHNSAIITKQPLGSITQPPSSIFHHDLLTYIHHQLASTCITMGLKALFLMNSSRRMRPDLVHPAELAEAINTGDESRSKAADAARRSIRSVFRRHAHRKTGAAQSSVDPEPETLTAPTTQCYRFQVVQQQVSRPVYRLINSTSKAPQLTAADGYSHWHNHRACSTHNSHRN